MEQTYRAVNNAPSTEGACSNKGQLYDNNHNKQEQIKKNVSTGAVPRKREPASESPQKMETENPLMKATPVFKTDISNIMHFIKKTTDKLSWDGVSFEVNNVHFIKLDRSSEEYLEVQKLFKKTNKRYFKITQIERIQNPFLLAAFLLKKEEMRERIGAQHTSKLFHGTKNSSAKDICRENFDWRLYGQNFGHKFGRGVSFTPISNYATHYSDEDSDDCVMLLTWVLVGKKAKGTVDTDLPPKGYDTTVKPNGEVVVKYEDNEFYPAYKITYTSTLKNWHYYDEDDEYYDEDDEYYDEEDEDEYYDEDDEYYDEEDEDEYYDEDDEYYDDEDENEYYDEDDEYYDVEDEDYDEEEEDYDEEEEEEDEYYGEEDEDEYYDEEDEYYGNANYYYY